MFDLNPQFTKTLNQNPNHHSNYRHRSNGGVQFRLETMDEDSGVCSPPLWRSTASPPDSPARFPNSRALSPASRAQAIARGQREMMEMVESMPETSYELSLKDIVEQRREFTDVSVDETQSMEDGERRLISGGGDDGQRRWKSKNGNVKRQESARTGRVIVKNGSMNHDKGLLINMFLPFSIGSKKKKKKSIRTNSYSGNGFSHVSGGRSSPRAELLENSGGGGGGDRKDWYSESLGVTSSSSGGESTGRSGSSGSSGSSSGGSYRNNSDRIENDCTQGCWSLFPYRKKKS